MPRKRDEGAVAEAAALAASGMSRAGIATALGVSEHSITRWLGRKPGRPRGGTSRTTRWRRQREGA